MSERICKIMRFFPTNSTNTLDVFQRNGTLVEVSLEQWETNRTGPFADAPSSIIGWLRIPPNASTFENRTDPAAGRTSARFENDNWGQGSSASKNNAKGYRPWCIRTGLLGSLRRYRRGERDYTVSTGGAASLNTTDPLTAPTTDRKFLSHPVDQFIIRESMCAIRRFLAAPSFQGCIVAPFEIAANATDNADLGAFVRNFTTTKWHPVGTASMSAKNSTRGVVDSDLLVKNTSAFRVVDASILPFIPAGHPQAVMDVIAERAAELIKQRWKF